MDTCCGFPRHCRDAVPRGPRPNRDDLGLERSKLMRGTAPLRPGARKKKRRGRLRSLLRGPSLDVCCRGVGEHARRCVGAGSFPHPTIHRQPSCGIPAAAPRAAPRCRGLKAYFGRPRRTRPPDCPPPCRVLLRRRLRPRRRTRRVCACCPLPAPPRTSESGARSTRARADWPRTQAGSPHDAEAGGAEVQQVQSRAPSSARKGGAASAQARAGPNPVRLSRRWWRPCSARVGFGRR